MWNTFLLICLLVRFQAGILRPPNPIGPILLEERANSHTAIRADVPPTEDTEATTTPTATTERTTNAVMKNATIEKVIPIGFERNVVGIRNRCQSYCRINGTCINFCSAAEIGLNNKAVNVVHLHEGLYVRCITFIPRRGCTGKVVKIY